jgi:aromatic ring-opening dioxygenase LigB subunit
MLAFGVISPHPPIILPEIGGTELAHVRKTIAALEDAAEQLAAARPDKLIIIAPHTEHGYQVPLYYLGKHLAPDIEVEKILVTHPSYQHYLELGKKYGVKIRQSPQRIAVIASGDLSHVLKADGPYGYHPAGPQLDEIIVSAIRGKEVEELLNIDTEILDFGAECGLRSILFLFGVFAGTDYATEVLSYEGPFGVGYMVATFAVK